MRLFYIQLYFSQVSHLIDVRSITNIISEGHISSNHRSKRFLINADDIGSSNVEVLHNSPLWNVITSCDHLICCLVPAQTAKGNYTNVFTRHTKVRATFDNFHKPKRGSRYIDYLRQMNLTIVYFKNIQATRKSDHIYNGRSTLKKKLYLKWNILRRSNFKSLPFWVGWRLLRGQAKLKMFGEIMNYIDITYSELKKIYRS